MFQKSEVRKRCLIICQRDKWTLRYCKYIGKGSSSCAVSEVFGHLLSDTVICLIRALRLIVLNEKHAN